MNETAVKNKNINPNKKVFLLLSKKLWNELIIKKIIKRTDKIINIEPLNIAISLLPINVAIWIETNGATIPNIPNKTVSEVLPLESFPYMFIERKN